MIELVRHQAEHLRDIEYVPGVRIYEDMSIYEKISFSAYTVMRHGEPVAAFGAARDELGDAELWMLTGVKCVGPAMLKLTKFSFTWLPSLHAHRITALVNVDFKQGHRWMRMLGFRPKDEQPDLDLIEYEREMVIWAA